MYCACTVMETTFEIGKHIIEFIEIQSNMPNFLSSLCFRFFEKDIRIFVFRCYGLAPHLDAALGKFNLHTVGNTQWDKTTRNEGDSIGFYSIFGTFHWKIVSTEMKNEQSGRFFSSRKLIATKRFDFIKEFEFYQISHFLRQKKSNHLKWNIRKYVSLLPHDSYPSAEMWMKNRWFFGHVDNGKQIPFV